MRPSVPFRDPAGRARRLAATLALLLLAGPLAAAQTLAVRGGLAAGAPVARIAVEAVPRAGGTVGLAATLAPAPGIDATLRGARAFGALGTLTIEAQAGARALPELRARLALGARGAFGPIAGRIEARAWAAPDERFDPFADPGPARAEAGLALRFEGEGRVDRTWLVGGATRAELGADGAWAFDVRANARARRLLGDAIDLELRAGGRTAGAGAGRAHVAAGAILAERRAPEVAALVVLDVAPAPEGVRFAPGLETRGARTAFGGRVAWTVRLRPLAASRAPWWGALAWSRPLGEGTLRVEGAMAAGGAAGDRASVAVGFERSVRLP